MKKIDKIFIFMFGLIIVLANFQLFEIHGNHNFYLHMPSIRDGEIWRLLTHPFAHLSFYHLATDVLVFLILFRELRQNPKTPVYKIILFCWVISSIAAVVSLPKYGVSTFGGLSGINYGLLIYYCMHQICDQLNNKFIKIGFLSFLIGLVFKQILEGIFQVTVLQEVHYGYVGTPIVESHSGGILAGLIVFYVQFLVAKKTSSGLRNPVKISYCKLVADFERKCP